MANATKLPSGNWRVKGYNKYLGAYKSFTRTSKREAERAAMEYSVYVPKQKEIANQKRDFYNLTITLAEAAIEYRESRSNSLSPSTRRTYKNLADACLCGIGDVQLRKISENQIQKHINNYAKNHSEKSCRDLLMFIKSVCKSFGLNTDWAISLPQKQNDEITIPEDEEMRLVLSLVKDKEMEAIIRIGAELGLRRSEICALTWEDIEDGIMRITKTFVMDEDGNWLVKQSPKSKAGFRKLKIPSSLYSMLTEIKKEKSPATTDRIFSFLPTQVTQRWTYLRKKAGVNFRFHDLRHFNASVMMEMGIPDKYSMMRLGHSTPEMTRRVYQHIRNKKNAEVDQTISEKMDEIF